MLQEEIKGGKTVAILDRKWYCISYKYTFGKGNGE
jgi:hypothetical protein